MHQRRIMRITERIVHEKEEIWGLRVVWEEKYKSILISVFFFTVSKINFGPRLWSFMTDINIFGTVTQIGIITEVKHLLNQILYIHIHPHIPSNLFMTTYHPLDIFLCFHLVNNFTILMKINCLQILHMVAINITWVGYIL